MIAFAARVPPHAKPRPRFGRRRRGGGVAYMPEEYRRWQRAFRACVPRGTIVGPAALRIVFATKTGRMRPDIDNAAGAVMDALQPDTIANDRDVLDLSVRVIQSRRPEIRVEVEALVSLPGMEPIAWAA